MREGQDVSDTLGMVPYCPVTFEVTNQGDGHCPIVAAEYQGPYLLADVGREVLVSEDVNYRLVV